MLQRILRRPETIQFSGKPTSSLYDDVAAGIFPPPIKLSKQSVGWLENELATWQRAKIAGKSDAEIKVIVADLVAARTSMQEAA